MGNKESKDANSNTHDHTHYFALVALVAVVAVVSLVLSVGTPSSGGDLTGNVFKLPFFRAPTPLPSEEEQAASPEEPEIPVEPEESAEPPERLFTGGEPGIVATGCKQFFRPSAEQLVTGTQFCQSKYYQYCVGGSLFGTAYLNLGEVRSGDSMNTTVRFFHLPLLCNQPDTPAAGPASSMERSIRRHLLDDPQIIDIGTDIAYSQIIDVDLETVVSCCSDT